MIRFIKNILDIKNILGMARALAPYPANELIIRSNGQGDLEFIPVYTGTLTIVQGANTNYYPDTLSGTGFIIPANEGDSITITGNITGLDMHGFDSDLLAVNDSLVDLKIAERLYIVDLRNADQIQNFTYDADEVDTLYAIADNAAQKDVCVAIITNSSVSNGTLWIDGAQAYAADVIAAAQAKGWRICYVR